MSCNDHIGGDKKMVQKKEPHEDSGIFRMSPIFPRSKKKKGIPVLRGTSNSRIPPVVPKKNQIKFENYFNAFFGYVRDIRVNAQDLHDLLSSLSKKNEIANTSTKSSEIKEFLQKTAPLFKKNEEQIKEHLDVIPHLMKEESSIYDYLGDEIGIIENLWNRCTLELSLILKAEDESLLSSQITAAQSLLEDIIFHAGLISIPSRASQHLDNLMIGQPLDFHETFKDELPKKEDRLKILQYLSTHPGSIEGIVVPEKGIIYKASRDPSRVCFSLLLIGGMVLVGALGCYFAKDITGWLRISLPQYTVGKSIFTAYLLIMLGGLFHIGIDALKQVRSGEKEFLALEKGFLWIQVKEVPIIMSIFSLWVGLLFLIFYSTTVDWKVAFFVGYSIDSVVDLFLKRFTASASTSLESLSSSS
jgi:hypothetical protein